MFKLWYRITAAIVIGIIVYVFSNVILLSFEITGLFPTPN